MAEISLHSSLRGQLEQRQQLSAGQHHSLEILTLPLTALESRLLQEFSVNPVLEEITPEAAPDIPETAAGNPDDENDYEHNATCADEWSDELPLPQTAAPDTALLDFLGNSPAPPPSLKTALLTELDCADFPEKLYPAAVEIISALDDDGFIQTPLADIAMSCDCEYPDVLAALELVQSIAPPGVAARDVAESLKLQLERSGNMTPEFEKLFATGMEELEKNQLPALAAKLKISMPELEKMLKILRTLNPAPGREPRSAWTVLPDLEILRQPDGNYITRVKREYQRQIKISPLYEKMLDTPGLPAADREYLQEKILRAKELIQALALRESTLKRLGDVLISEQRDFLDHGMEKLKPLTMKQVAAMLDLSESTISRAVAEKFADTPQGVIPLRCFFSGGYNSDRSGDEVAAGAVKELLKRAIADEDKKAPLSDEALAAQLKARGVPIARRTVAKYRESLKIPPASRRKKFF